MLETARKQLKKMLVVLPRAGRSPSGQTATGSSASEHSVLRRRPLCGLCLIPRSLRNTVPIYHTANKRVGTWCEMRRWERKIRGLGDEKMLGQVRWYEWEMETGPKGEGGRERPHSTTFSRHPWHSARRWKHSMGESTWSNELQYTVLNAIVKLWAD